MLTSGRHLAIIKVHMREKTTSRPVRSALAEAIGSRIRALRQERRWSQTALCAKLGIDTSKLSKYENGEHLPPHLTLVQIADAFGVSLDLLMGRPVREPSPLELQYRDAAASMLGGALLLLRHVRGLRKEEDAA